MVDRGDWGAVEPGKQDSYPAQLHPRGENRVKTAGVTPNCHADGRVRRRGRRL